MLGRYLHVLLRSRNPERTSELLLSFTSQTISLCAFPIQWTACFSHVSPVHSLFVQEGAQSAESVCSKSLVEVEFGWVLSQTLYLAFLEGQSLLPHKQKQNHQEPSQVTRYFC